MKKHRSKRLRGLAAGLLLLAAAVPFAASAQSGAGAAPYGANPAGGFPGFGMNPFMRPPVDDGPTDGKDHPNYHISTPVEIKLPYYERTSIDVRARIDRQAGFRLEATTLSYQNYAVDPEKPADAAPVLFGGKFAEDVSVNDTKNKWTNLLQPFRNAFIIPRQGPGKPFDPSFDTFISFEPGGCEITLVEHDKSLEVIATNRKAEPTRFRFNLSNGDPSADRKEDEKKDARQGGFGGTNGPRPAAAAAGSTDGKAHPDRPTIAPAAIMPFKPEQKIVIRGTVDQSCGFQIKGNTLSYLNSKATRNTSGFNGSFKLTFGGKYASGVTVNGEAWTGLNRPVTLNTTLKELSAKHITFKGPSCSFDYRKCGDAVEVFIGNYDKNMYQDKPAQFEIVLYFADPVGTEAGKNENAASSAPAPQRAARPQASENGDLKALLRALENTPGVSEVELDLVRRRIADLDRRRIEQMQGQDQQKDEEKNSPASGTPKEPAGAGEITLTLKGNFDGRGVFVFEGNTIRYKHEQHLEPVNVTVNGAPWADLKKPFKLGFTPDFEKAVILDKLGRDTVKLIPGRERFELLIDDSKLTSSARYQVVIAAKNQIARPPKEPTYPVSLTVKGVFGGRGTFVFEGKAIQYRHENGREPAGVTIDGVPWDDLAKPFELNFTPDFAQAVIEEQSMQSLWLNVTLIPERDRIALTVNSIEPAEYSVKIAAKNQNRRPTLPPPRSIGTAGPFGQPVRTGPTDGEAHPGYAVTRPVISPPEGMYNGAKVEVKGMVDRKAAFRFEGMNLIYQNYATDPDGPSGAAPALFDGKFAYDVTVNGREWAALAKPFPVGARIDTAKATEVRFHAEDCAIAFSEHDKVLEVIVTNKTGEPAPFQFTLWIEGPPRSNLGNGGFGGFGGGMGGGM